VKTAELKLEKVEKSRQNSKTWNHGSQHLTCVNIMEIIVAIP
jgi:hypothetical protein